MSYTNTAFTISSTPTSTGITLGAEEYVTEIDFKPTYSLSVRGTRTGTETRTANLRMLFSPAQIGTNAVAVPIATIAGGQSSGWGATVNAISHDVSTGGFLNDSSYAGKTIYAYVDVASGSTSYYVTPFDVAAGYITVTTTLKKYTVSVSVTGTGTASASPTSAAKGETVTLTTTPGTGQEVKNITTNPSVTIRSNQFTMPANNVGVSVAFGNKYYTLTTNVSPSGKGSVTAGGSIIYQGTKELTATPSTGYSFSKWTNSGGSLSSTTTNPTTFTMGAANATVTANFTVNSYGVSGVASPVGGGTVSGGGTLNYGATTTFTATASSGYTFSKWRVSGGSLSSTTTNPTTFTMGVGPAIVYADFTINNYTLTVSKGTGISVVTGGGSVQYTSSNNITATVASGYTFNKWTSNNGGTFGNASSASTTFTMPVGNTTVTASATANSYTLTVNKGTGISAVTGGGSKQYTSSNAITATAATGYSFKNWTSNNGGTFANANSASTTFTMPIGNTTITANAQINSYKLTVSAGTGGTVSGGGTVNYNSSNNISATASTGYTFKNWTSNNGGTFGNANSASTTFTMPAGAVTVTANFTHNTYALSKTSSPAAGGTITLGATSGYYGTEISISASPATGYQFSKWTTTGGTIANANSASTKITMPAANATVTATFTKINYTVSKASSPSAGGTVTTSKSTANYGDSITISASPATGYKFTGWSTSPSVTVSNNAFTMPASNITVTASFAKIDYTVSKASNPSAGGSVTLSKTTANYGDSITVSASAATGYTFSSWSSSPSVTISNNKFSMPASNVTITANFTHNVYTLTGVSDPAAGGSMTLSKSTAYYGDSITVSATAATGYHFDKWVTSPSVTVSNNSFSMPNGNITVTAKFVKNDYTVAVGSNPNGAGTVSSNVSTAQMGDTVTLSQTPKVEYAFDGWTSNPSVTITENQFTMPASNIAITAQYHLVPSNPSLDASSYTGGSSATLTISSASSSFTHKYRLRFGADIDTGWVDVAAGVSTVSIYIPVAWQLVLHGATSISGGTLSLQTYSGTFLVGEKSVGSLTYNALGGVAISLVANRSDAWMNPNRYGKFATYTITKPSAITQYSITYEGTTVASPSLTGIVLPGSRRKLTAMSTEIVLNMTYGAETITVYSSIPGFQKITKSFNVTEG